MNHCSKCNNTGLMIVLAKDYSDPIFESIHARASVPHYGNMPLVMNCECHYDNPLSQQQVLDAVNKMMDQWEYGTYPMSE